MTTIAIITARGGSKSIPLKNIISINGKPVISYPINAALNACSVDDVWVDTDSKQIADVANTYGAKITVRPQSLSGDNANHGDCILDATQRIIEITKKTPNNILVLLANTVMIDSLTIDRCSKLLMANSSATGILTAWKAGDDHPSRALIHDNQSGYLKNSDSYIPTSRQLYQDIFYYDQGVWLFKTENLFKNDRVGPGPWWWMGNRCLLVERPWVTGRDINGWFDVPFHENWYNE